MGKDVERKQLRVQGTFQLLRNKQNVTIKPEDYLGQQFHIKDDQLSEKIASLLEKNGDYWIYHSPVIEQDNTNLEKNPEQKLWNIVKHCKIQHPSISFNNDPDGPEADQGYQIMPNDIIKLGRVRFKVKELISPAYQRRKIRALNRLNQQIKTALIDQESSQNNIEIQQYLQSGQQEARLSYKGDIILQKDKEVFVIRNQSQASAATGMLCRICLQEETDDKINNPMFSPCKCAGTMKYIHLQCLQEWLNSRVITKETNCTKTYYWKNLECELCKTPFPNLVRISGGENESDISLNVVKYQLPQPEENNQQLSYIVLESLSNTSGKVIHVVNMNKTEEAKIGRGHDVDVRITDISVSRLHALIKKTQKGYFYIQDNRSKFGTLAMIRTPKLLSNTNPVFIQAGRSLLEIQVRMPVKIFNSCFCFQKQSKGKVESSVKFGLISNNGLEYFPEEFLPRQQQKKDPDLIEDPNLFIQDLILNTVDIERPVSAILSEQIPHSHSSQNHQRNLGPQDCHNSEILQFQQQQFNTSDNIGLKGQPSKGEILTLRQSQNFIKQQNGESNQDILRLEEHLRLHEVLEKSEELKRIEEEKALEELQVKIADQESAMDENEDYNAASSMIDNPLTMAQAFLQKQQFISIERYQDTGERSKKVRKSMKKQYLSPPRLNQNFLMTPSFDQVVRNSTEKVATIDYNNQVEEYKNNDTYLFSMSTPNLKIEDRVKLRLKNNNKEKILMREDRDLSNDISLDNDNMIATGRFLRLDKSADFGASFKAQNVTIKELKDELQAQLGKHQNNNLRIQMQATNINEEKEMFEREGKTEQNTDKKELPSPFANIALQNSAKLYSKLQDQNNKGNILINFQPFIVSRTNHTSKIAPLYSNQTLILASFNKESLNAPREELFLSPVVQIQHDNNNIQATFEKTQNQLQFDFKDESSDKNQIDEGQTKKK